MSSTLRLSRTLTLASSSRLALTQRSFHTTRIARDHFLDVDAAVSNARAARLHVHARFRADCSL
jgi:hypothetical protein